MHSNPVLLLGDTGFLGGAVARLLSSLDIDYVGVSRSSGIDLRIPGSIDGILQQFKFKAIINCAAHVGGINYGLEHSKSIFEDNTLINLTVVKAASEHKLKLINAISNCAYPGDLEEYREEDFWSGQVHPSVFSYATTRRHLISASILYANISNFPTANLVFPNIYGPGEHSDPVRAHALGGMVQRMIGALENSLPVFVVWGSGTPIREWLFIEDAARALVKALELPGNIPLINVGSGESLSIKQLAYEIKSYLKFPGIIEFDLTKPDGSAKKVMVSELGPKLLSWSPNTKMSEGISKTIDWYRDTIKT